MSIKSIEQKFTSANSVPVERAMVTREEWEAAQQTYEDVVQALDELLERTKYMKIAGPDPKPYPITDLFQVSEARNCLIDYRSAKYGSAPVVLPFKGGRYDH